MIPMLSFVFLPNKEDLYNPNKNKPKEEGGALLLLRFFFFFLCVFVGHSCIPAAVVGGGSRVGTRRKYQSTDPTRYSTKIDGTLRKI